MSTPPPLSPQIKQESQDMFSTGPPPLSPAPAPRTHVQAINLQRSSVTQDPLSAPDPLSDTMFVNSDLGNSYLAEEPEVADSEGTSDDDADDDDDDDDDVRYVDFWLSSYITYF